MTFRAFVRSRSALLALAMASLLAACAMEPLTPIDSRLARQLDNVRLDPVAAESAVNAYRASRA